MNEKETQDKLDRRRLRYRLQYNSQITNPLAGVLASASRIRHAHCQTFRLIVLQEAGCSLVVKESLNLHNRRLDLK